MTSAGAETLHCRERHAMLEFISQVARRAGALLRDKLTEQRALDYKGAIDLTTDADRASEALIVGAVREAFPEHRIIAEEGSGNDATSPYTWLIDPLDGTTNYTHGFPFFSVSIALLHHDAPRYAVVYAPISDELFAAEQGAGTTCNGQAMRVSAVSELIGAVCSTGFPYDRATRPDNNLAEFGRVLVRAQEVRRVGSAALELAYVAAGRLDAHWERDLKPWDTAAGALLVREAGGVVTCWDGGDWSPASSTILASNGRFHTALSALLCGEA
jgi:myo-inositol-1(or 4)-monophosphatase